MTRSDLVAPSLVEWRSRSPMSTRCSRRSTTWRPASSQGWRQAHHPRFPVDGAGGAERPSGPQPANRRADQHSRVQGREDQRRLEAEGGRQGLPDPATSGFGGGGAPVTVHPRPPEVGRAESTSVGRCGSWLRRTSLRRRCPEFSLLDQSGEERSFSDFEASRCSCTSIPEQASTPPVAQAIVRFAGHRRGRGRHRHRGHQPGQAREAGEVRPEVRPGLPPALGPDHAVAEGLRRVGRRRCTARPTWASSGRPS